MSIVWISGEQCWGTVLKRNAGFCIVRYRKYGMEYEEIIENEDLVEPKDMGIDYETEDI